MKKWTKLAIAGLIIGIMTGIIGVHLGGNTYVYSNGFGTEFGGGKLSTEVFEEILPKDIIIVEGIMLLEDKNLRKRLDIKIYVDTEDDIRILRRIQRDIRDRGRTI